MTEAVLASVSGFPGGRPVAGAGKPPLRCICTAFGFDDAARGLVMLDSLTVAHSSVAVYVLCLDEASERAARDRCPQARVLRTSGHPVEPEEMPAHLRALVAAEAPDAASITWVSPSVFFYRAVDGLLAGGDAPVTVVGAPPLPHLPPPWITWRTGDLGNEAAGETASQPSGPQDFGVGCGLDAALGLCDGESGEGKPVLDGELPVFIDFAPVTVHPSGLWQLAGAIPPDGPAHRLAEAYAVRTGHVLDSLVGSAGAPPAGRCFSVLPARGILDALTPRADDEAIVAAAAAHCGGRGVALADGLSEAISDRDGYIARYARLGRDGCLFHAVPVTLRRPTMVLRAPDGREPASRTILNEGEVRLLFARHGLRVQRVWQCPRPDLDGWGLDGWGITVKSFLCTPDPGWTPDSPLLLNIGCGDHFHEGWLNMDVAARHYGVLIHDAAAGLPFPDRQFDGLYQSHVLEHLARDAAPALLRECYRVLKPGGVLRIVVPDLEGIARAYLDALEAAVAGEAGADERHDWMVVELLDQLVRHESEGAMGQRLSRLSPSAADHVVKRIGRQAADSSRSPPRSSRPAPWWAPGYPSPRRQTAEAVGRFRLSGEVHRWMYDRHSLAGLLALAGFGEIRLRGAAESALPSFSAASLDLDADGTPRKPDSLYMEGVKPR